MSALTYQRPGAPPLLEVPAGAVRDEQGYVVETLGTYDESTWEGRLCKKMNVSSLESHKAQRSLGYKVYESDPGKDPRELNDYDRKQLAAITNKWMCTLL